jgi:predicted nucleotidyltransferase
MSAPDLPYEPASGALVRLAQRAGTEFPALLSARRRTEERLAQRRTALAGLPHDRDAAVVLCGSWGRGEVTRHSDDDWWILVDGAARPVVHPQPDAVARALHEVPPGIEGLFGSVAFRDDLRDHIGLAADTNANFTRRMLLVLESVAVTGQPAWSAARRAVLAGYLDERSSDFRPPRFFLNDIVRYWRTITVDFEGKDRTRGGDGWGLRAAKLRTSRKLLFASGLLPILECHRLQASEMLDALAADFAAPATDRIAAAFLRYDAIDLGVRVLAAYDRVLQLLDDPEVRAHLVDLAEEDAPRSEAFTELRRLADQLQNGLLSLLFDDRRLAPVVREYAIF